jgi:hypothetical protein
MAERKFAEPADPSAPGQLTITRPHAPTQSPSHTHAPTPTPNHPPPPPSPLKHPITPNHTITGGVRQARPRVLCQVQEVGRRLLRHQAPRGDARPRRHLLRCVLGQLVGRSVGLHLAFDRPRVVYVPTQGRQLGVHAHTRVERSHHRGRRRPERKLTPPIPPHTRTQCPSPVSNQHTHRRPERQEPRPAPGLLHGAAQHGHQGLPPHHREVRVSYVCMYVCVKCVLCTCHRQVV